VKIGIVLEDVDRFADGGGTRAGAFENDAFAGFVVRYEAAQVVALGCRVLGVAVIVIQARAVEQNAVAAVFAGRLHAVAGFVELRVGRVLRQLIDVEAAHVVARVFGAIVPRPA
jgi:hypothetical protein